MIQPELAVPRSRDISGELLDAEKRMLDLMEQGASLPEILSVPCLTAEAHLGSSALTSVLLLEDGQRLRHAAAPSLPAPYNEAIDGLVIGPSVGSCGSAAFLKQLILVSDIEQDERWSAFRELARTHGLRACWSMPIEGSRGRILGTFAIYYRHPRAPTQEDLRLIERLALISRVAIERYAADGDRARLVEEALASQAAAEAERTKLRQFIMNAPAVLCLLRGPTHTYELANDTYLRVIGNRSIIGKSIREALPELAGQGLYELLDRVYSSGEPFIGKEVPVNLLDASGALRQAHFNFVYQPTLEADGKVSGIAVYANDVTELVEARNKVIAALDLEREARASIQRSEAQFRALFDSMPQLGWSAKPDGFIEFYNRGWYAYTGSTYEDMQGWGWKQVHDPQILPQVVDRWQRCLETGTPFEMEFPLRRHDGVFRWFLTRVNPVRDANGNVIRWVGVNTDVDDLRAAKALSEEMAAQSRETEAVLRTLLQEKASLLERLAVLEARAQR